MLKRLFKNSSFKSFSNHTVTLTNNRSIKINVKTLKHSSIAGRNVKWYSHCGKYKKKIKYRITIQQFHFWELKTGTHIILQLCGQQHY